MLSWSPNHGMFDEEIRLADRCIQWLISSQSPKTGCVSYVGHSGLIGTPANHIQGSMTHQQPHSGSIIHQQTTPRVSSIKPHVLHTAAAAGVTACRSSSAQKQQHLHCVCISCRLAFRCCCHSCCWCAVSFLVDCRHSKCILHAWRQFAERECGASCRAEKAASVTAWSAKGAAHKQLAKGVLVVL